MAQRQQSRYDYSGCRMGRAVARALDADSFVDDFDWHFVSQDGLAVKDAWEMATAWASILQAHVSVRGDHSHHDSVAQFAIAPNYEWVEFWLGCCEEDVDVRAVAARASSLVWRALASCRGYGHQENALFWKRLFSQLQNPRHGGDTVCNEPWDEELTEMTDDHRFFDNMAFPRFTLKLSGKNGPDAMDRMARLFVGLLDSEGSSQWSDQTASQLKLILTTVAPFMETNRSSVSHPVQLALRLDMRQTDESRMNDLIDAIHAHHQPSVRESDRGSDSEFDVIGVLMSQPYTVDCVAISDSFGANFEWHLTCGSHLRTPLATRAIRSYLKNCAAFRDFVRWAPRVDSGSLRGGGVRHLQFRRDGERYGIPAICSALPHTRSLQTFQIAPNHMHNEGIDKSIVAWLGYALFHPDSASSSWRKLFLNSLSYEHHPSDAYSANDVLAMMAKGNNLLVALQEAHSDTLTDAYYTATIRAGGVNPPFHVTVVSSRPGAPGTLKGYPSSGL